MKLIIASVLTSALVLAQINHQFAQRESKIEHKEILQTRNERNILVSAVYYKGVLIPSVKLPVIEITANGKSKNTNGYNLHMIEVTAERNNPKLLPATKYNGKWIAMVDLPVVEIVAKEKRKLFMASVFSFDWLVGRSDKECKKINY